LKSEKRDADKVTNMKDALAALAKLIKDAKTVLKELDKATSRPAASRHWRSTDRQGVPGHGPH